MNTRKEMLLGSLSFILIPFINEAKLTRSMLGGFNVKNIKKKNVFDYSPGYIDLIEEWTPIDLSTQHILLSNPLVPLSNFTIDGCMTYHGIEDGNSDILSMNDFGSTTFSIWYRNRNALPRCYASEGSHNPIAIDVCENPTFCFSIRFDNEKQMIEHKQKR